MKWNRKGILLCIIICLGLIGLMVGRVLIQHQRNEDMSYASEEDIVFPDVSTGKAVTGPAIQPAATQTAMPEKKKKIKAPAVTKSVSSGAPVKKEKKKNVKKTEKEDSSKKVKKQAAKKTPEPLPMETAVPTDAVKETDHISFTIQCNAIMNHKELWKDGIEEIIPSSGCYYQGEQAVSDGETVYDILKRICKEQNIALDAEYTPVYGTYYVKGIGNLYEFDCGDESGWKYKVNGILPGVGCSNYQVKKGDEVTFFYDYRY